MVSVKYASILVVAAFVAGTFVASPELRAYAANTVFSSDIVDGEVKTADLANNAVTAAKIKDGEVKAAEIAANAVDSSEIAADAVGGSELQGVTKLLFLSCSISITNLGSGNGGFTTCSNAGIQSGDHVMTTLNTGNAGAGSCIVTTSSVAGAGFVSVRYRNECPNAVTGTFAADLIIFRK